MAKRLQAMGKPTYAGGFDVAIHEDIFIYPLQHKKPKLIFVNSMSDLFHEDVSDEVILQLFDIMRRASWHTFQILTKRAERLSLLNTQIEWPSNIWAGVSVETDEYKYRIDLLRDTGARTKFISIEPLLGPIGNLNLRSINWVIVGGESGPYARKMDEEWVIQIRDECLSQRIPFFFKQWGGKNKKKNGRLLEGRTWDEMPIFLGTSDTHSSLSMIN
jgi:protein gp37